MTENESGSRDTKWDLSRRRLLYLVLAVVSLLVGVRITVFDRTGYGEGGYGESGYGR